MLFLSNFNLLKPHFFQVYFSIFQLFFAQTLMVPFPKCIIITINTKLCDTLEALKLLWLWHIHMVLCFQNVELSWQELLFHAWTITLEKLPKTCSISPGINTHSAHLFIEILYFPFFSCINELPIWTLKINTWLGGRESEPERNISILIYQVTGICWQNFI